MSTIDTTALASIDTTALATIFTWVWDQYGDKLTTRAGKADWERLRWEEQAQLYGEKVQWQHGTMRVLGQHRPVSLEGVYTAVHLLDRPTAERRFTLEELVKEFVGQPKPYFHASDKEKRRDGLEMVGEGKNLFILGKPGAGKTTFLKHVALHAATGELGRVPIFVSLNQLSRSDQSVFDFIIDEFDACDFPDTAAFLHHLLKGGRAILLFDGLDEVNETGDARKRLTDNITAFLRKYGHCQCLITCRLAANKLSFHDFTYVEMADFDANQIQKFVTQWFGDEDKQRKLFLSELAKSESEGLRELARVPLLLALLCLAFESTLRLSQRRVELYRDALDALLRDWDDDRDITRDEVYSGLSKGRKKRMLAEVAAETFKDSQYFIPQDTLTRKFEGFMSRLDPPQEVDGENMLRAIIAQHGLLHERAHRFYSFAHLTFQEYFAAQYYAERPGSLPGLVKHFAESRWYEVFLLTATQLPDAEEFFNLFIEQLAIEARSRPAVVALLRWAARKASITSRSGINGATARSIYIFLVLDRAYSHSRALQHANDSVIELNSDRDRDLVKKENDLADRLSYALTDTYDSTEQNISPYWLNTARNLDPELEQDLRHVRDLERARPVTHALAVDLNLDVIIARARAYALARAWDRVLARARARVVAHDFEPNGARTRRRERDQAHLRKLAHRRQRALDRTFADACMRDLRLSHELRKSPHASVACDLALVNAWLSARFIVEFQDRPEPSKRLAGVKELVTVAAGQSGTLGRTDMQQQLASLAGKMTAPSAVFNCEQLAGVAEDLRAIMGEDWYMIFPDLNKDDREALGCYLDGNLLLLECLNQAIVSDRAAIEDRLLLLPEA